MPDRVAPLIQFFVSKVPGAGRTQLFKFLYLADLEARRHLGRPLTDLDYIWYDYGPFDSAIYAQLDSLMADGSLTEELVEYPNGWRARRYSAGEKATTPSLSKEEKAIGEFVAATYGRAALQTLLDDVVYQTALSATSSVKLLPTL
jgi:hypothetical protein